MACPAHLIDCKHVLQLIDISGYYKLTGSANSQHHPLHLSGCSGSNSDARADTADALHKATCETVSIRHFLTNSFFYQQFLTAQAWRTAFPPYHFPPLRQTGNWEPNHPLRALLRGTKLSLCTPQCCGCSGCRAPFSCRSTLGNDNIQNKCFFSTAKKFIEFLPPKILPLAEDKQQVMGLQGQGHSAPRLHRIRSSSYLVLILNHQLWI